jgi:hypothetical protein
MQVYWKDSVRKRNTKLQVNCAQSYNLLSGMCASILSPYKQLLNISENPLVRQEKVKVMKMIANQDDFTSGTINRNEYIRKPNSIHAFSVH